MNLDTGRLPNLKSPPQRRKYYQISGSTGTMMRELADGGPGTLSPRSPTSVDADHIMVKTEMLRLRLMEKKRELVRRTNVNALMPGSR